MSGGYPYLKPEEEAPIVEAFDALFEAIESRTDPDTGNVVLFSRENASTDPIENPLSVQEVEKAIAGIRLSSRAGLARNRIRVVVVPDYSSFPPNEDGSPHTFTAGYIPGTSTIAIVAMRVRNARSARKALLHEMVGHFGLNLFAPAVKQDILDRINRTRDGKALSGVWKEIKELHADKSEIEQAEEVFARIAENTPSGLRLWLDRFLANVLAPVLRKLGLVGPITKSELHVLAADIARGIREGKQQRTAADGSMLEQRVFHGTPHRGIERTGFKLNKIGTGEGAQAYGWGMYFSSQRKVADQYRQNLSGTEYVSSSNKSLRDMPSSGGFASLMNEMRRNGGTDADVIRMLRHAAASTAPGAKYAGRLADKVEAGSVSYRGGQLYHAEIPENSDLLDWDKPLSEQSEKVREALVRADVMDASVFEHYTGQQLYENLGREHGEHAGRARKDGARTASEYLQSIGIPGLRYLDGNSRAGGEGTHNYVIWDEALLTPGAAKIEAYFSLAERRDDGDAEVRALVEQYANVDGAPTEAEIREAIKQYRDTDRSYGGKPAYDKAKADGRTKLTYGQWVQVRTPNFKRWFGDWQATQGRQELRDGKPVGLTGKEVSQRSGDNIDMKAMREEARAYAAKHVVGQHTNQNSGVQVEVRSINEALQHHAGPDKIRDIAAVPEILTTGTMVFDGKNPKNPRQRVVVIAKRVSIDGQDFIVTAGIRGDANGRLFYDHEMLDMKKAEARLSSQSGAAASPGSAPSSASARLNDYTIGFMAQADGASKVIDPQTGEPLVVYHGAPDARFMDDSATFMSIHDRYGEKRGVGVFWFAKDRHTAASYADPRRAYDYGRAEPSVIPAFLNLRDPQVKDGGGKEWREAQALGKTTDVIEKAQAIGSDGAIIRNVRDNYNNGPRTKPTDTFVAFDSRQIKSAEGNIGTFNGNTGDIRFSFAGQQAETADTPELSAARTAPATPLAVAINEATRAWGDNAPHVRVLASADDLPADAKRKEPIRYRDAEGYYDGNTVYLVEPNLRSPAHALRTLAHEAVGHYGVDRIVDEFAARDGGMDKLVADITRLRRDGIGSPALRAVLAECRRRNRNWPPPSTQSTSPTTLARQSHRHWST